ncbi:LysR family transcriptional regulator [Limnohabitans sp. 2KL-51]|jgi:DNA-binding transcriptional LysR family regulator|uniref:LysR family transcriptional regulator n=1 Tax=Limnohabitans sp. 2KL-51 TaxID=1977911 RepID=UPI000D38B041|nr:LysR family transcriptional regulator [Limnohabitans sp. 2KL-51]PUE45783.1 LysR family transcriptional regulator [Limnohabitans sp. 2KL-51]
MKFSFFETLEAVLRTGSLSRAADEMNLTPSAISMQMKQVEIFFGQPLFDRSGLQVKPMPFAHEVASVMQLPMQQIEQLRRRNSIQIEGTIRLGVIESMQASLLPGVIQHLLKKHPALQLKPARGRAVELIAAVKANELDAAIVVQPVKGGSQRLHWQHLFKNELVVIAPPTAKAAKIHQLFCDYPWIRFDASTSTGKLAAQWIGQNMPQAQRSMDLPSVHAVLSMVNAGLGVSMVPSIDPRMMMAYPVRVYPIGRGAPALNVVLLTRKNEPKTRLMDALFESIQAAISIVPITAH